MYFSFFNENESGIFRSRAFESPKLSLSRKLKKGSESPKFRYFMWESTQSENCSDDLKIRGSLNSFELIEIQTSDWKFGLFQNEEAFLKVQYRLQYSLFRNFIIDYRIFDESLRNLNEYENFISFFVIQSKIQSTNACRIFINKFLNVINMT